jgi:Holliday junction resolvase
MTRYNSGANFERKVKKQFEDIGWYCTRSAGSKGKIDIICQKKGYITNIQCKLTNQISKAEIKELKKLQEQLGNKIFIASKKENEINLREVDMYGFFDKE